jgi:hypothetical protein
MTSRRLLLSTLFSVALVPMGIVGCTGDTDGGTGAGADGQYVSDGAAGGAIRFKKVPASLEVAESGSFEVEVRDAQGNTASNVQVVCDSERGVAILEPTTGREHTGSYGTMSGVIGGDKPGSFLFECRAEQGYNLAVRTSVKITGDVPAGFTGFPGAAGGNMGGGVSTPSDNLQLLSVTFAQNGDDVTALDSTRGASCTGGGAEPFSNPLFKIKLKNDTLFNLNVSSVKVVVVDGSSGGNPEFTRTIDTEIAAGQTGTVSDVFFTAASGGTATYPDGSAGANGTFQVRLTVSAQTSDGTDRSFSTVANVTLEDQNNC